MKCARLRAPGVAPILSSAQLSSRYLQLQGTKRDASPLPPQQECGPHNRSLDKTPTQERAWKHGKRGGVQDPLPPLRLSPPPYLNIK